MEKSSHIDLPIKGIICTLKFSYIFLARHLCVTFDATNLAKILETAGHSTLREMRFTTAMDVERNSAKEETTIKLSEVILDSTAEELRTNRHLYEKMYYMPRNQ